ncbi:MAG: FAD-binding protein [Promicromonosporaceae bacterium]|nr:FAD-binding protein [Promicromonosporaceae bacterium]
MSAGAPAVAVSSAADIARVLRRAAAAGLRVSTTAPPGPGHVRLDLSAFDEIAVAPVGRTVRVGAGASWERLVSRTSPHGLAVLPGDDLGRAAVRNTLAGAVGPVARTFGLSADHVLEVDVVTPDGTAVRVTPDSDEDLFCALRGGAEGLGVVTSMRLGTIALTTLRAGTWWFAPGHVADASTVLHRWRTWLDDLPESMSTLAILTSTRRGVRVGLRFAHVGDQGEAAALLDELRDDVPSPARDTVIDLPPSAAAGKHLREAPSVEGAVRSGLLDALPAEALDDVVAALDQAPPGTRAELRLRGGAVGRGSPLPGCVPGRDAAFSLRALAATQDDADALVDAMGRWTTGGTTLDLGDPLDARTAQALRVAWGESRWAGLATMRRRLDPRGVLLAPWEPNGARHHPIENGVSS